MIMKKKNYCNNVRKYKYKYTDWIILFDISLNYYLRYQILYFCSRKFAFVQKCSWFEELIILGSFVVENIFFDIILLRFYDVVLLKT